MEIVQSIIIGIVQGITEFLPISSSAHLVLTPYILNWDYRGLAFDVSLHFGTVIAILVFFWRDWIDIIKLGVKSLAFRGKDNKTLNSELSTIDYPSNTLWQIAVATIPAVILGFFLSDYVEEYLHSPLLLAANLAFFGLVLWLVDKNAKNNTKIKDLKYASSFKIGLAQALALIPGVSRSGITMIAARGIGLNRESAARFSFLLGTPAMVGALLYEARNISLSDLNAPFILGVAFSAIAGFFAIKFLLNFLKKSDFKIFAIYRVILAFIITILFFFRT